MNLKPGSNAHQKWGDLLTAVFTLCALDSKLESRTVDRLISESRVRAARRVAALKPSRRRTVDLDALGHVTYHWQRSTRYLDGEGQPLHIAPRGRAPSIEALFREIGRSDYFEAGLIHLKQVRRIKRARNGRYFPVGEVNIVPSLTPEIAELVAQTVNRLLATVVHNTSLKNRHAVRLIERNTAVPDLPVRQVNAFKLFAREQGAVLIDTLNDWLESRRGTTARRRKNIAGHVTAGLHVFAFVERNKRDR
jgi:hypothetical protein